MIHTPLGTAKLNEINPQLSMMCISGLMHTIAGALDHAILLIWTALGNRALRPRLPSGAGSRRRCSAELQATTMTMRRIASRPSKQLSPTTIRLLADLSGLVRELLHAHSVFTW